MNPEIHRPEPAKKPLFEKPQGIPVGDGWTRVGNYFTRELPTGGVQKLNLQEWEKMTKSKPHRETVAKGLEMQATQKQQFEREELRQRALRDAREALTKEFGGLKPGDKETRH